MSDTKWVFRKLWDWIISRPVETELGETCRRVKVLRTWKVTR